MISDFTKEEKDENVANANTLTQENFERHLAAMAAAAAAAAAAHGSTTGSSRSSSSFLIKDILFPRSKVGCFLHSVEICQLPLRFYVKLILMILKHENLPF